MDGQVYVDVDMIRDAIQRRASFNVVHLATMFKTDVFILLMSKKRSDEPDEGDNE